MRVAEIFSSIHGECNGHHQGRIVTFVRLSGCNLKCYYCDTKETQDPEFGEEIAIEEVLRKIGSFKNKYICITGGEPLLSHQIEMLLYALWNEGFKISIETNGTIDITPYFRYVDSFVIDYKLKSTKYSELMVYQNYVHMRDTDIVKFVVANKSDLMQALSVKERLEFDNVKGIYAFSPVEGKYTAKDIYKEFEKRSVYNAVLSLQIHKVLDLK